MKTKQILLTAIFLIIGIVGMVVLIKSKKPQKKVPVKQFSTTVDVSKATLWSGNATILGTGFITPKDKVILLPEVGGKIVFVSPNMRAGKFVRAGEPLFKIDPKDYLLRVQSAQSLLAQAKLKLEIEKENANIAKKEWELYQENNDDASPNNLVLRKPQVATALVAVKSAESQLKLAKSNLAKSVIRAPFSGFIEDRFVSRGQVVGPGTKLAIISSSKKEIVVGVKESDFVWLKLPNKKKRIYPKAIVSIKLGNDKFKMTGKLTRILPSLDKMTDMVSVVISLENKEHNQLLKNGIFANVSLEGKELNNVIKVPVSALRSDSRIFIVKNGALKIKKIDVLRTETNFAFIKGINDNDLVVISSLKNPVENMTLNVILKNNEKGE